MQPPPSISVTVPPVLQGRLLGILLSSLLGGSLSYGNSIEEIDHFESRIRPILIESCSTCHGEKKQKGGLRLDTAEGIRKGSDFQPVIIPGNPNESLLIQAIERLDPDLAMPPDEALTSEQINLLRQWITSGAALPQASDQARSSASKSAANHWAFQPIQRPPIPNVIQQDWPLNPIDHFILAGLEAESIPVAEPASSHDWLRRVYDDVIGLPPTWTDQKSFAQAPQRTRVQKVIDRLLASPAYGERWGRHWLDVARYADTKGQLDGGPTTYAFAYTYRDWVIQSMNQDMPFDNFVRYQLAADLMASKGKQHLPALGFLTVGHRYHDRIDEIMDDRIDVVSRGLVGLTVACARCHDHKYDPIPTTDYYAMYGVFRSNIEPYYYEKPILPPATQAQSEPDPEYLETYQRLKTDLVNYRKDRHETITHEMRAYASDYLAYVAWENPKHRSRSQFLRKTERTLLRAGSLHGEGAAIKWKRYVQSQTTDHPVFGIWHRLAALSPEALIQQAQTLIQHGNVHPHIREELLKHPPQTLEDVGRKIGEILEAVYHESQESSGRSSSGTTSLIPDQEVLRHVLYGKDSPCVMTERESRTCFHILESDKLYRLERAFQGHLVNSPESTRPRAMVLSEKSDPFDPYVFVRGDAQRRGRNIERGFLDLFSSHTNTDGFDDGSGRQAMAEAIVHPRNPLTARVISNRIWNWHFGQGLVRTSSDFGTRSDPPTHPELLDFLAAELIAHDWSLKHLHRLILTSRTFAQSSLNETATELDPDNQLWGRMNRRRLSFESMRDSILTISEELESAHGGFPERDFSERKRSVYLFVNRNRLDHRASFFDFPDPGLSSPGRSTSVMPQQSLFLMNDAFIATSARLVAYAAEAATQELSKQIEWMYRPIYGRNPSSEELRDAGRFIEEEQSRANSIHYPKPPQSLWEYGYGVFNAKTRELDEFRHLPHWSGRDWRGSDRYPDRELGFLRLTKSGGHPERTWAVVRRFVAPSKGQYRIQGALEHELENEADESWNGVRASILRRGGRLLKQGVAKGEEIAMETDPIPVLAGETIDFVVDAMANSEGDRFEWAIEIEQRTDADDEGNRKPLASYESTEAFAGPPETFEPLIPLGKLAHALFQTNEFMFLD